jgi:hypothetical protein
MKRLKKLFLLIVLTFTISFCSQKQEPRLRYGKTFAEQELKLALTDTTLHNIVDNNTILIKDSLTAISIVEPILFSIYGKDNIVFERPYETYFIDNYWIISGSIPKGVDGGAFLVIVDSRNCKLLKVTHLE